MKTLFKEMYGNMTALGRCWLYVGLAALAVASAMSFDFGYNITLKHAVFLAILSVVFAFGPDMAREQWDRGRPYVATAIAVICIPLGAIEFYTHAGYTAGVRGHDMATAKVQNIKYSGAQDAVSEDKANLAMWKQQLNKLNTEHAWAATVKADGLRASLASADEAIKQEAARGGCGPKCLGLMKEKASLEERIAIAERATDLTSRIEATQRILDKKRKVASTTEYKSSAVEHQNNFLAKAVTLVTTGGLEPTDLVSASAEQTVNLAMAIAGTGLPAFALFIAGLYRRETDGDPIGTSGSGMPSSSSSKSPADRLAAFTINAQDNDLARRAIAFAEKHSKAFTGAAERHGLA